MIFDRIEEGLIDNFSVYEFVSQSLFGFLFVVPSDFVLVKINFDGQSQLHEYIILNFSKKIIISANI